MEKVNLYRYVEKKAVIITPHRRNETDSPAMVRLVASEGMILTNGSITAEVYDVPFDRVPEWREIVSEGLVMPEVEEKAKAYDILMGVAE